MALDTMKVLIAVESSEISEYAFDYYFKHVHKEGNKIILVHCPTPPKLPTFSRTNFGGYPSDKILAIMKEYNEKIQKVEHTYTAALQQKQASFVIKMIDSEESVAHRLIRMANEEEIGLMVMGSRISHSGLVKRSLLQSVTDHVTHHATFPVLTVMRK